MGTHFFKRTAILSLFLFVICVQVSASTSFQGKLEVRSGVSLVVIDGGYARPLASGPVRVEYSVPRFLAYFSDARQIEITQGMVKGLILLSSSEFTDFEQFSTPTAGGQFFRLVGGRQSRELRRYTAASSRTCTYTGTCMYCSPESAGDGQIRSDCSTRLNSFCLGSEPTEVEVTEEEIAPEVRLKDSATDAVLGLIRGDSYLHRSEKVLRVTGECR